MRRSKLKVAVGLLTGHTTFEFIHLNLDSHSGRTANCAGMKKQDRVYIVCHWHAKGTKPELHVLEAKGSIQLEGIWPHWSSS
jgi:hypothetical protein